MSNMSYCRFENTLPDLEDCYQHLEDDLSDTEKEARERLIRKCVEIALEFGNEVGELVERDYGEDE